ncbi:leukosialin [Emydura macquarii macquarii]|uniref:leukosialin n=1 Tax=Emydura macquarii macquarii TaxID=1129001 RepID=UPI00352BD0A5
MGVPGGRPQPQILAMLLVLLVAAASVEKTAGLGQDAGPGTGKESQHTSAGPEMSPSSAKSASNSRMPVTQLAMGPAPVSQPMPVMGEGIHSPLTNQPVPASAGQTIQNQPSPVSTNQPVSASAGQTIQNQPSPVSTNQPVSASAGQAIQNQPSPVSTNQPVPASAGQTIQNQTVPASADQTVPASTDQTVSARADWTKQNQTSPANADRTKQNQTGPAGADRTIPDSIDWSGHKQPVPASTAGTGPGPTNEGWKHTPKPSPVIQFRETNTAHSPTATGRSLHVGIIVAAVITVLLLLLLLLAVALQCRHRRRSGSTSFNAGSAGANEWAGPVALPEERDGGQAGDGGQGAKPGDSRRPTLTTFFGKRHSRVSSVAMEDVAGAKDGGPLLEALLATGEQGGDPAPQGGEAANGTVPATPGPPLPLPEPPANGEFPLPPPVEQEAMPPV